MLAGGGAATTFGIGAAARRAVFAGAGVALAAPGAATGGERGARGLGGARDGGAPAAGSGAGCTAADFLRGGALARATGAVAAESGSGIAGDCVRGEAGRRGKWT